MRKIKILVLSLMLMCIPMLTLAATGHIDGCTNTTYDTSCCTKTFNITAKPGYTVTDVIVNGVSKGAQTSVTLSNITGPQTIKVVTEASGGGGAHIITFNGNGATAGSMYPLLVPDGLSRELPRNAFTKTDHLFTGWSTSPTGSVEYKP